MSSDLTLILEKIKNISSEQAIKELSTFILMNPDNDEAYTLRGMKYWSLNQRKEAIKDYLTAIKINPDSKAKMALQYAYSILDYYNKDLLNP